MGVKGAKRTAAADTEQAAVVELLSPLGEIGSRPQFGGYGIFVEGKMFALVTSDGCLCLKVGDANRADYDEDARFGKMPYYRVPAEVRGDTRKLRRWAKKSIALVQES